MYIYIYIERYATKPDMSKHNPVYQEVLQPCLFVPDSLLNLNI